jgi:hypothetical protein
VAEQWMAANERMGLFMFTGSSPSLLMTRAANGDSKA